MKSYETLETYGDTILKLASTLASVKYLNLKNDSKINEGSVTRIRQYLITNHYLFKLAHSFNLGSLILMEDPEVKKYSPPHSASSL